MNQPTASPAPREDAPRPRFAVFGHTTLEIVIQAGDFPIRYQPNRTLGGGITIGASGTAYNIASALHDLGNEVTLCATIGADPAGALVTDHLATHTPGLALATVDVPEQPVTAVLSAPDGRRLVLNDFRTTADFRHRPDHAEPVMADADVVVLPVGPVNTTLIDTAAHADADLACDVHAITTLNGEEAAFCQAAEILFMSHERLPTPADHWLVDVMERLRCRIAVVGQGEHGASVAVRGDEQIHHVPAIHTGPVASTLGAGDALFAAFLDAYTRDTDPITALRRATVFASATLAHIGGAAGHISADELDRLVARLLGGPDV